MFDVSLAQNEFAYYGQVCVRVIPGQITQILGENIIINIILDCYGDFGNLKRNIQNITKDFCCFILAVRILGMTHKK